MPRTFLRLGSAVVACSLAFAMSLAVAAQPDARTVYDCEAKAAEYTKNMGKAGDRKLYEEHLKLCLEVVPQQASQALQSTKASVCPAGRVPVTFVNNSGEDVWIGAWNGDSLTGPNPPEGMPNWKLGSKGRGTLCMDKLFSGRFTTRAGCNEATGTCLEGNCCNGKTCPSLNCYTGTEAASVAEITLDAAGVAWYDVSYVDGFNFPLMIETNVPGVCAPLGGPNMPSCPWYTVDGVCMAPYLQYALENPWSKYEQDYYVLAAKCAAEGDNFCGCGNQCTSAQHARIAKDPCPAQSDKIRPYDNKPVAILSAGCSPFQDYLHPPKPDDKTPAPPPDTLAAGQVICNPLKPKPTGSNCHEWNDAYKIYASSIHAVSPKAYTWQYHDDDSLTNCKIPANLAFTITVWPRPANQHGNRSRLQVAVNDRVPGGTLQVLPPGADPKKAPRTPIKGIETMTVALENNTRLILDRDCDNATEHLSCELTYTTSGGLKITDDKAACTGADGNISTQTPGLLAVGKHNQNACTPRDDSLKPFMFHAADQLQVGLTVNKGVPQSFQGPQPYTTNFRDKDAVSLSIACDQGKHMVCTATFDAASGFLVPDANQESCTKAPMGWATTPFKLFPGKPAADLCK